ncbi:Myb-like_DNA-binding domain-containing protein [Hexamita inflata]|uniref:Myb-like DNA-binding domain-containing protein n=1 Tax=Hexamita inflata TaxID=28002 RepID=A0AA86QV41_9EUKA|nr:Myb-like DNA-binding domain-containing protein [Hexamita inflata]CAI9966601.1 Myb-like DNA-binding domain-containing protein [Hexamita inflata]
MTQSTTKSKWNYDEEVIFDNLCKKYKLNFRTVADHFPNRSYTQVRSHYYNKIKRKEVHITQNISSITQNCSPQYEIKKKQEAIQEADENFLQISSVLDTFE